MNVAPIRNQNAIAQYKLICYLFDYDDWVLDVKTSKLKFKMDKTENF